MKHSNLVEMIFSLLPGAAAPNRDLLLDNAAKNWLEALVLSLEGRASAEALLGVLSLDDAAYQRWVEALPPGGAGKERLLRIGFDGGEAMRALRGRIRLAVIEAVCGAG